MNKINEGWCLNNNSRPVNDEEVKRYISVVPSRRQLEFLKIEYYNFIHFGINTIYNREWGDGKEDISRFNPKSLDTDQWCRVLKATGSGGIIITAKHHDGFCLFDSAYTDHKVTNTPFGKDIVAMLAESCKKYGIRLGIYLSPWDRHEKTYGTDKYNEFFVGQLTELCTSYGEIFCFWFDGACGEGENGKKQKYDWQTYYSVIRKYQPDAVISVCGPDVRWIGNEGGRVRESEWSVIPADLDSNEEITENSQSSADQTKAMAERLDERTEDLGSRQVLKKYDKLIFKPAEADVSVNYGWFHNSNAFSYARRKRSPRALSEIYFNTVGGNASLLLNVPANRHGLIGKSEERRLRKFTKLIKKPFVRELEPMKKFTLSIQGEKRNSDCMNMLKSDEIGYGLTFGKKEKISAISLSESLSFSQRTEQFKVFERDEKGEYTIVCSGSVIGSKKIIRLKKAVRTKEIVIVITQSREAPFLETIKVYGK